MRAAALILALALVGCGGARPAPRSEEDTSADAARWTSEAAEAWGSLDPERAASLADRALQLGAGDEAKEIAARAQLALGHPDRAESRLAGVDDPVLLRLRARAEMALGQFDVALATLEAARRHGEEDPWTESVFGAVRAAAAGEPYALEGDAEASLPLEPLPLPVVRVRAGTVDTLALIGSSTDLMVLDPSIRDASGALDELALGGVRVRDVPFVVRTLEPVRQGLGAEVRAVIGAELLLRLSATIDGHESHTLTVHRTPPPGEEATSAPILTPSAAFLVVPVRVGQDGPGGWMTLDTAGLFPVALTPGADESLGLSELEWREGEGGVAMAMIPALRIGDLVVQEIPAVRGLLTDAHARAVGAPIAGSIGWALLGQLTISFDPQTRRLRFE